MERRAVLVSAIILTLIIEVILIILVYNNIGDERLTLQIGRLTVHLILILWVFNSKSNIGLFLLTSYHILTGIIMWYSSNSPELFGIILIIYHIGIGLIIYFHDLLESKLKIKNSG